MAPVPQIDLNGMEDGDLRRYDGLSRSRTSRRAIATPPGAASLKCIAIEYRLSVPETPQSSLAQTVSVPPLIVEKGTDPAGGFPYSCNSAV